MMPQPEVEGHEYTLVKVKVIVAPKLPSAEAIRAHQLTHQSYRGWCRYCVIGRSDDVRHAASGGNREHLVISMDYTYLIKPGEGGSLIFVVHDANAQSILASVVPSKGVWMTLGSRIGQCTNGFGHGKVVLKTDQEPAIVDLMRASRGDRLRVLEEVSTHVRAARGIQGDEQDAIVPEHSPAG